MRYAAILLTSVSLNMVLRCWGRLPDIFRTKHPSLTDLYEKHFDRLLDYLITSSDVLVDFKACPLLETLDTNLDVLESRPLHFGSSDIPFNPGNQETRHALASKILQLVEVNALGRQGLSNMEQTSQYSPEETLILAKRVKDRVWRSMTGQSRTERGSMMLSQNKGLQDCEDEQSQSSTTANGAVHTPRARRLWLQHLHDWFSKLEDRSSVLRSLVNQIQSNTDNLDQLLYLRELLNHSYCNGSWSFLFQNLLT